MTRTRAVILLAFLAGLLSVLPLLRYEVSEGAGKPVVLPAAAPAPDNPPAAGAAPPQSGVDLTGLNPEQTRVATEILGQTRCNCSCGMTLSECRVKDPKCSRSLTLAQGVVQDLKSGKDRATVQSNLAASLARLATPPAATATAAPPEDPNKVYKIDTTGAPYKGPKGAKVVIVEFSDYQ
jgi:hypothetical protein